MAPSAEQVRNYLAGGRCLPYIRAVQSIAVSQKSATKMVASEADYALRPLLIFILWPLAILVGVCYAFVRQSSNRTAPWKPLLDYAWNAKAGTCFDRTLQSWGEFETSA